MRRFGNNLKFTLSAGFAVVLILVCAGLFWVFDTQSRKAAIDSAQDRQSASLRILIDKFSQQFPDITYELTDDGAVSEVRWDGMSLPEGHELIDAVGRISGETATLFQWVPEEGDFIRRTTNIIKPDGERAVGTWLGKANPVHAIMLDQQTFRGEAVILGNPYYTIYQPILDAQNNVLGIFYVGVDKGSVESQISQRVQLALIASTLAVIGGLIAVWVLLQTSLRPMAAISNRLQKIAEGALDAPVPHTHRSDALGVTARVVDGFRQTLAEAKSSEEQAKAQRAVQDKVVTALRKGLSALADRDLSARMDGTDFPEEYEVLRRDFDAGVQSLADALHQAGNVASNVRMAASEIGSTSDELARRVEMQAATLMQSAEALNGLTSTSRDIKSNVDQADALARKSRELSDESEQVVRDAIGAINRIEETSDKINQIITAIDDIAFQTNLLALNAGVEAARAGSAGKGFAVVASEVRSLAQTAANSAQEIKTLITASGEEVSEGSRLVQKTGSSLSQVQEQVESLGQLISNIAESVRVQTEGLADINEGVQRLEGATQENAAIVEELNASGQSLNMEAERLSDTMRVFEQDSAEPVKGGAVTNLTDAATTWTDAEQKSAPTAGAKKPEAEVKKAVNAPTPMPEPAAHGEQTLPETQASDTDWGEEF
ncbi:methyl-accepting chemotaxis protein [Sagittula sp. SSi028]|uniref:methyl-accepting chemotaxis protein n=1 Tax=Sagittula sp. SSi028 TaxID=3400636 RepID=UPI003AF8CC6B